MYGIGDMAVPSLTPSAVVEGSTSKPVYFEDGVPKACTGTLPTDEQIDRWEALSSTDEKVKQTSSTDDNAYPLLCKYNTTNDTTINSVNFVSGITVNPSTKTITAPKLNISWSGPGGDGWNNNVKYPVTNKALVIGQAGNGTTLYINRFGIQAWN